MSRVFFAIGLAAVIVLSVFSFGPSGGFEIWDKAQHALAYAALAFTGLLSFPGRRAAVAVCLGLVCLGILLELAQTFLESRVASLGDAAANGIGVIAGMLSVVLLAKTGTGLRRQRSTHRET